MNLTITIVNKMNKFIQIILISLFSLTMISCSPDDTETVTKPISKLGDVVSDVVDPVGDVVGDVVGGVGDVVEDTVEAATDVVVDDSSCSSIIAAPSLTANGSAGQVSLDWNAVGCAISYTVFWDNSTGISSSSTSITGLSDDNYTHSNLDNGSTYYYKVAAIDAANTSSDLSSEVSAATPLPAPDNLSISGASGTNTLTWNSVSGATSYTLYWDNVSVIDSSDTAILSITNENYTHSSLSDGTYYYKVAAVNSSGTGTLSSVGSAILSASIQGSETNDGHTYAITTSAMNWENAKIEAASLGGYLSTVNTKAENDWLTETFISYGNFWIGAEDKDTEGTWIWDNGTTSDDGGVTDNISAGAKWPDGTLKWGSGEPNNSDSEEHCLTIRNSTGVWNDVICDYSGKSSAYHINYGVIEFD